MFATCIDTDDVNSVVATNRGAKTDCSELLFDIIFPYLTIPTVNAHFQESRSQACQFDGDLIVSICSTRCTFSCAAAKAMNRRRLNFRPLVHPGMECLVLLV